VRYLRNNPRFVWLLVREALAERAASSHRERRAV